MGETRASSSKLEEDCNLQHFCLSTHLLHTISFYRKLGRIEYHGWRKGEWWHVKRLMVSGITYVVETWDRKVNVMKEDSQQGIIRTSRWSGVTQKQKNVRNLFCAMRWQTLPHWKVTSWLIAESLKLQVPLRCRRCLFPSNPILHGTLNTCASLLITASILWCCLFLSFTHKFLFLTKTIRVSVIMAINRRGHLNYHRVMY